MRYDQFRRVLVVVVVGLLLPATLLTQQKPSARGARLSSVTGSATVKAPGATEAVPAQENMPIEEGSEVSTSAASSVSVRLENASTIELSELSKVDFTQTNTGQEGTPQNVIILEQGDARFKFLPSKQAGFAVHIADATISPNGKAAFMAGFDKGKMNLRVLEGSIVVSARSGSLTLDKGRLLEYDPSAEPMAAASHVRVVRLSYLSGTVTLKRPGSTEEEKALLNTPVQEGFELSTADSSYAEVEFENGSTARVGEHSTLLFNQLALDANGNKLNGMTLEQGYGTFNFTPERRPANPHERNAAVNLQAGDHDVYQLKLANANATLKPDGKCEFRTDLAEDRYRVEVFKGSVEVARNDRTTKLGEGKSLIEENGNSTVATNKIPRDDWDQWTEARDRQAVLVGKDESIHPVGMAYGWSDLNTYGEWVTLPGNRFGWSPYAPVGWSPYSYGMWNWYGGMGWTWISADPWGWVTDHCGYWDFDPTFGWYWGMPMFGCGLWYPSLVDWYGGPGWYGWAPIRPVTHPRIPPGRPHLPGVGPVTGQRGLLITKVPASVIQKGQLITAQVATRVPATEANKIEHPPAEATPQTTAASNSAAAMAGRPVPQGAHPGFGHAPAPAAVLMGGDPAKEGSLLAHHGFLGPHGPLRAAQGTTLGGRYPVQGSAGEFHGSAATGGGWHSHSGGAGGRGGAPVISSRAGGSGVSVASHGSGGGASGGHSAGSASSGGGGRASGSGGGGGFSGGGSSVSSSAGSHSGGSVGGGGGGGHH